MVRHKINVTHNQGSNMNMKGQMYFERNVYDSQRIDINNMGHVHSKYNVYEN
jgi:hypothetical protein